MAVGVPMYYLTARSRAQAASRIVSQEGGARAIISGKGRAVYPLDLCNSVLTRRRLGQIQGGYTGAVPRSIPVRIESADLWAFSE